nr:acyl-CoA/acyl-ACP dehydrogenase [Prolixibacteraceae bacterium]
MNQFKAGIVSGKTNQNNHLPPFAEFLQTLKEKMELVFHNRSNVNQLSLKRGLPPFALREIMSANPLSVGIPKEYGGRGGLMHENIALMATTSYESLALSLTLGINSALFLQPVGKYAQKEVQPAIFKRFLEEKNMGGLMITEPGFGSDALNMQTRHTENNGTFHIKGEKHWAGLTGWADYWLLTARQQTSAGNLQRDIDFFICDVNAKGQEIEVEETFENLGLYMIPYGRNRIDVRVPAKHKLQPQ